MNRHIQSLLMTAWVLTAVCHAQQATPEQVADQVHGVGPVLSERIVRHFEVHHRPVFDAQPIAHINLYRTPWWLGEHDVDPVDRLIELLDEAEQVGITWITMNGVYHSGAPGIDAHLPAEQFDRMNEHVSAWLNEHPHVRLGMYFRSPGGLPEGWQFALYDNWDEWTQPWIDMGLTIFGVDASQRHGSKTILHYDAVRRDNPDLWLYAEAHGDFTFPYPTFAIPRWFWNRYWRHGMDIPDVRDSLVPRYVRMSGHTVNVAGEQLSPWEAMGITRDAMLVIFVERGYYIMGSLSDIAGEEPIVSPGMMSDGVPGDTLGGTWCDYLHFATCSGPHPEPCIDDWLGESTCNMPHPFTVIGVPAMCFHEITDEHIEQFHTWIESTEPLRADINGDGFVDVDDLLIVLNAWGGSGPGDITCTGEVGVDDLLILLNHWGEVQ